ncbi:hypothetical protein RGU12_17320 [Fredinandcohnia sp. QZ13]|uniref:hypothetical protein n=1 Tax=Fredinandcohnia sp. QZ13 TaxID=3073144 RepID=UPI0028531C9B|nr:hypothetical protein [Fredinandcohnia sp. QZ13]MDR4889276.1 hypothetical protein [Fredinandcohnia sp. QZ13]
MKRGKVLFLTLLLIVGLLTGCASVEDESKETISSVETAFNAQPEKTNSENGDVSFYLPSTMKIEKKDENNVILQKGNQTFILFVNPNEERTSDALYKEIDAEKFMVDQTFKDKERYGYVKAYKIEDKLYIVTVGIGGIKMTTEVKVSEISESASEMMKIVSSVQY